MIFLCFGSGDFWCCCMQVIYVQVRISRVSYCFVRMLIDLEVDSYFVYCVDLFWMWLGRKLGKKVGVGVGNQDRVFGDDCGMMGRYFYICSVLWFFIYCWYWLWYFFGEYLSWSCVLMVYYCIKGNRYLLSIFLCFDVFFWFSV